MNGLKIYVDHEKNKIDSKFILGLINELTLIHNSICADNFFWQEPKSPEELRAFFEMCELEIIQDTTMNWRVRIKFKDE